MKLPQTATELSQHFDGQTHGGVDLPSMTQVQTKPGVGQQLERCVDLFDRSTRALSKVHVFETQSRP
jgi:hypothetical protein